jgi:predicted DNA-binding protein
MTDTTILNIHVPVKMNEIIEKLAKEEERSKSAVIRFAIKKYIHNANKTN